MNDIPNPGSLEAIRVGCLCPHMGNNFGHGIMFNGAIRFYISEYCPLHGRGTCYLPEQDWLAAKDLEITQFEG